MFITFEGCEGCGKTTQIKLLKKMLTAEGYKSVVTREPGGCQISDKIREILLDPANKGMKSSTELLLYCASRAQHLEEVILPALAKGVVVLCDRFSDATIAYQHFGRGIKRGDIEKLNQFATKKLLPDLTILLDGDMELFLARANKRNSRAKGVQEGRFEQEEIPFHQRVRNGYRQIAMNEPHRMVLIDANGTVEEVAQAISNLVLARLKGIEIGA